MIEGKELFWWADHFIMAKENLDFGPLLADQGSVTVAQRENVNYKFQKRKQIPNQIKRRLKLQYKHLSWLYYFFYHLFLLVGG